MKHLGILCLLSSYILFIGFYFCPHLVVKTWLLISAYGHLNLASLLMILYRVDQ